jgi:serine/threonine-protein kinase
MKLVENAVVAGKFRLNRMLGGGGMGSVWHATHLGLDIPCAVKFVRGELLEQEDIKARFEREAKAAAQLRSPHVVQILDHGVCEGTPYIAMELLDGEDLGTRLERVGRLPPEQLHKIMSEACRALAKAHAQGIVHRDLKPDNIYIVRDDDREITKVLDFGIAKTRTNEIGGSSTKTGAMLGTPYYMSPEQAQGTKAVDFRSDLWSLAVIAFQCVTGRLPFESEALGDLLVKIIIAPIPLPSQYAPVPLGFDKWWGRASARDPAERFQSAKEFSDALALVCGVSHVSGVVDRSQLRVVADAGEGASPALGSPKAGTAAQPWVNTTSSFTAPFVAPSGQTPYPVVPGAEPQVPQGTLADAMTTGSAATPTPLTRSFGQGDVAGAGGKAGLVIAMAFGGVLFLSVLGGVGWFLFGRKSPTAASADTSAAAVSPPASATSGAGPTPSAPPPVAQAQDTSAAPPATPDVASNLPSPSTPPPVNSTGSSRSKNGGGSNKSASGNAPAPGGAAKPAKPPKQVDMGF